MLKACTVQTLVRSMAMAADAQVARLLEAQAIALMCELLPCDAGFLLLGAAVESLRAQLRERAEWKRKTGALCAALELMDHEEVAVAPGGTGSCCRCMCGGVWGGVLDLRLREGGVEGWSEIALMTALALENAREVESLQTQNALLAERLNSRPGMVGRSARWSGC
ncbi:MAG: hypothetical protein IPJ98_07235 [Bryobacterales bacterium]|nr:hypothetical protein [Bryobacterales bacterium]